MSYDTEHYYNVHTFLEDDELHKIWNIVEKAMNEKVMTYQIRTFNELTIR